MNKTQFIASLAPHFNGSKKEAAHAVDIVFDSIVRTIHKGEDVTINDFGKFKKVDRKARKGRNPFTGETIQIKASKKVRFSCKGSKRDNRRPTQDGASSKASPSCKASCKESRS